MADAQPRRESAHPDWLLPQWGAQGVGALMTTRAGGVSAAPFDSLNLRDGPGDDRANVAHNQRLLAEAIGSTPVYLNQVHGAAIVRLTSADLQRGAPTHTADASVTTEPGIACAVQVADCLPVLFAAPGARAVGAAHAGWRGLSLGVLEAALRAVCDAAGCEPAQVQAWLGDCIGPQRFEVGPDVLEAFGVSPGGAGSPRFEAQGQGKWLADLPSLARDRLHAAGARSITGGTWCTVSEPSRFFSFRRDRLTGRMAAVVWIEPGFGT
jgi:polyphenol oxidase